MVSNPAVYLSDGAVDLEPDVSATNHRWTVLRGSPRQTVAQVALDVNDHGSQRAALSITVASSEKDVDVDALVSAINLLTRWAFSTRAITTIFWLGPEEFHLPTVLRRAGFRMHPFPQRQAWLGSQGLQNAWYGDIASDDPPARLRPVLTDRELDVLRMLSRGFSNAQIASYLGLSENTVKNHVHAILQKLHEPSRTAAVVAALRDGLIGFDQHHQQQP